MADEMYDRIEKQLEGNSLALAAVAEILQKMDYRMSEEEEYLLAKEEEEEAEADRESLILDIAHEVAAVLAIIAIHNNDKVGLILFTD